MKTQIKRMRLAVAALVAAAALSACAQVVTPCSAYACHPGYHNYRMGK